MSQLAVSGNIVTEECKLQSRQRRELLTKTTIKYFNQSFSKPVDDCVEEWHSIGHFNWLADDIVVWNTIRVDFLEIKAR